MSSATLLRIAVIALAVVIIVGVEILGRATICAPRPTQLFLVALVSILSALFWGVSAWLSMEDTRGAIPPQGLLGSIGRWSQWANFGAAVLTAGAVLLQAIYNNPCPSPPRAKPFPTHSFTPLPALPKE